MEQVLNYRKLNTNVCIYMVPFPTCLHVFFQIDEPPSHLSVNVIIECPHFQMKTQVELSISGWIFYKNNITYLMVLTSKICRFYPKWCTSCVRLGCQQCHWIRIYLYKLVLIKAFLSFLMVIIEKIMAKTSSCIALISLSQCGSVNLHQYFWEVVPYFQ